jgi:hypothetical protein
MQRIVFMVMGNSVKAAIRPGESLYSRPSYSGTSFFQLFCCDDTHVKTAKPRYFERGQDEGATKCYEEEQLFVVSGTSSCLHVGDVIDSCLAVVERQPKNHKGPLGIDESKKRTRSDAEPSISMRARRLLNANLLSYT